MKYNYNFKFSYKRISIALLLAVMLSMQPDAFAMNKNINKSKIQKQIQSLPDKPINPSISHDVLDKMANNLSKYLDGNISGNSNKQSGDNLLRTKITNIKSKLPLVPDFKLNKSTPLGLNIYRNESNTTPVFIAGKFDQKKSEDVILRTKPESEAISYIEDNKDLFLIANPASELILSDNISDNEGSRHLVFEQYYNDIPVWGKELVVHFDKQNHIYLINGRYIPTPSGIDISKPVIEQMQAVSLAESNLRNKIGDYKLSEFEKKLLDYLEPEAEKYIWVDDMTHTLTPSREGEAKLVWHVQIRTNIKDCWEYFIDAVDGSVIEKYNSVQSDGPATASATDLSGTSRTLNTYLEQGTYYLFDASRAMFKPAEQDFFKKGAIVTETANNQDLTSQTQTNIVSSPNNQWNDRVSVSAHYHLATAYEYYLNTHGRNSIDNEGMTILGIIHVTDNSQSFDNAYWNGKFMVFGDGGDFCKEWPGAKDFTGHELTHGVITHTVDLEYKFQSGALNEALADWGGAMIDRDDWTMGEDIARQTAFPTGVVRDMENPHNGGSNGNYYWQPAHMNEFFNVGIDRDNGGVHYNSGIINKATSLIGNAIGKDKLEKIYYRLLQNRYLTKQSQFIDMRLAAVRAATELYGANSNEVSVIKQSFDAVGIFDGNETEPDPDEPPVTGTYWMACANAQWIDQNNMDNSLLIAKSVINDPQTDIGILTQTQVYTGSGCVITIPDNGSFILFIDENNFVKGILPNAQNETFISTTGDWHSISISADMKYLAATTKNEEPYIYIFDMTKNPVTVKQIELYVPTTVNDDEYKEQPIKADALDWSLDGSVLVYDALNATYDDDGNVYQYWDINLLDPESGVIIRMLPPLDKGINAGNPVFSQNSDYFIAFDVFDDNDKVHYINVADIFTGSLGNIGYFNASYFLSGFPSWYINDTRLAFHVLNEETFNYDIYQIGLKQNKIEPSGNPSKFIDQAIFPKWFAIGTRPVGVENNELDDILELKCYPNPFLQLSVISYQLSKSDKINLKIFDIYGNKVIELVNEEQNVGKHIVTFSPSKNLHPGVYFYQLKAGNEVYTGKMIYNK